jgi:predicted NAD-dependent protein-ADP-ribosyltransferase YbiA (DUF1768 family)
MDTPDPGIYTEEQMGRIRNFYKQRISDFDLYTYDKNGDLVVYNTSGSITETIPLLSYIPHSAEFKHARDQTRVEEIAEAETKYEAALEILKRARLEYMQTKEIQPYLAAHKAVAEADMILSRKRYFQRGIQILPNPVVKDILFDQPYEMRKLFPNIGDPFKKELVRLITREYPYHTFEGSYTGEVNVVSVEAPQAGKVLEPRTLLKDGRYARMIFQEGSGENDIFSPFWPVDITTDNGRYSSAFQAYEVARELEAFNTGEIDAAKHADLAKKLLGTRSGKTIMRYMKDIKIQVKDPKGTWMMIYTNVFEQHEQLKTRLLETGTDALVFIFDTPAGAGQEATDNPSSWTGENAVGIALETLRTQFREGTSRPAGVREVGSRQSVITEDQQAAAKQAAIMGAQKKKGFIFKSKGVAF